MIINHNMSAINSQRVLKFKNWDVNKDMEKLSSGMRINRAGDDASGLAVSEKMRTQVQGIRQAARNTEDGMSFLQTAEGYMDQMASIIQRIRVLSVQSSNGIYTGQDRQLIQVEVSALIDEVDRIASQAEFNRFTLLKGEFSRDSIVTSMWFHLGPNMHQRKQVFIQTMTGKSLKLRGMDDSLLASVSTASKANSTIGLTDDALQLLAKNRADLGAYYNRLEFTAKGLMNAYENIQSAESRIRDTDMAEQTVEYTRNTILVQSGTSMLAQANMKPRGVLQLLQ